MEEEEEKVLGELYGRRRRRRREDTARPTAYNVFRREEGGRSRDCSKRRRRPATVQYSKNEERFASVLKRDFNAYSKIEFGTTENFRP